MLEKLQIDLTVYFEYMTKNKYDCLRSKQLKNLYTQVPATYSSVCLLT